MARAWQRNGFITEDEYYFLLKKNTFPLSMIDKITPHRITASRKTGG